jgi:photosystem II stability/assembly factor-like uncharacterized protein
MHYERGAWVRQGMLSSAGRAPRGEQGRARLRLAAARPESALNGVVNDMAFSPGRWFAATSQGLMSSDDRGLHWSLLPLGPLPNLPVQSVRISPDGRSLWVVSQRGLVFSHDSGRTWRWHDLPLSAGGALRLDLVFGPSGQQTLVASARNGLYISRDAGRDWRQAAHGLPEDGVEDFAVLGHLFVASMHSGGLYVSFDAGRTWSRVPGSPVADHFSAVAAEQGGAALLAASASDGLYAVRFTPPGSFSAAEVGGHE